MSEKITAADAIRLLDAHEAAAVDVREPDEFAVGHIPGAKLLPLGQVLSRAAEVLPDKNAVWLVYCRTGRRSADAVRKLESLGYTRLYDLGGILSWPYEIEGDFEGHFKRKKDNSMSFHAKDFAGSHCGCRYQQDYRPTLGRDGKRNPARWRSSSSITMVPSALSSTATAKPQLSCSAYGHPAWTRTAPCTGCCPTAARATTTRRICPKAGPRGRTGKSVLRRRRFSLEAGGRFCRG